MTEELFSGAKLKVKRANQHIQELQTKLLAFLQTDFYRLHVEEEAKTGEHLLKFEQTKPVPDDIPTIIGDAIHNLRATLDLVACEIVTKAQGATDYVKFPVMETRDELIAALNGGEIRVAGADIIALIRDVIQPYKGGNGHNVWVLHGLDITDKHLRLIPIVSVTALTHVTGKAGGVTFTDCTFAVGDGGKVNILAMPGKFTFQGYGQPTLAVLFDKGQVFEGQPIIPTLHQLSQLVSGIIHAFEEAYLARGQGPTHDAPPDTSSPDSLSKG